MTIVNEARKFELEIFSASVPVLRPCRWKSSVSPFVRSRLQVPFKEPVSMEDEIKVANENEAHIQQDGVYQCVLLYSLLDARVKKSRR